MLGREPRVAVAHPDAVFESSLLCFVIHAAISRAGTTSSSPGVSASTAATTATAEWVDMAWPFRIAAMCAVGVGSGDGFAVHAGVVDVVAVGRHWEAV